MANIDHTDTQSPETETIETAATAFDTASEMETTILNVERAASTLSLLSTSEVEEEIGDACYLLAEGLREAVADLKERQGKLFHYLHAQKYRTA